MVRVNKYYNGERIFSMLDLSEILSIPKYEIKNSINSFGLKPSVVECRTWYFRSSSLIPFVEYLITLINFSHLKTTLKNKSQNEKE